MYLEKDVHFMRMALALAHRAFDQDEVPVGAVVVDATGAILGRGYNQVEHKKTQTAHAECTALSKAAKRRGDWRLDGCTLYVTLEPCIMCMGLIRLSRLSVMFYATESPLFGYRLDNEGIPSVYKKDVEIHGGLCAQEAQQVMKQFFNKKRKKQ